VLKRQWQILGGNGCEYSIDTQVDLFCALIGLYNFGKQCGEDDTFEDEDLESVDVEDQTESIENGRFIEHRNKWMEKKRDDIADRMWTDYQNYIQISNK
jgi:hypothetical protein